VDGPRLFIGCGAFTGQSPESDGPRAGLGQREIVRYAEVAEAEGFDSFWLGEHHFAPDGYTSALFPLLGAIAISTERLVLGTRVILAPLHAPLAVAENAAQVALLAGGRFVLGLALGYRDEEFDAFGVAKSERVARLLETVEVCRKAWTGEPFHHDGPTVMARGLVCRPAPPVPPRLWLGGRAAAAIARAGALADGFVAPLGSAGETRAMVERLDVATPATARPLPVTTSRLAVTFSDAGTESVLDGGVAQVLETYRRWKGDDGGVNAATVPELTRGVVRGSPEAVARELVDICRALRDREHHLVVRLEYPGMRRSDVEEHIRLFGREVAPRLRAEMTRSTGAPETMRS
jgi:alkanesulfonate monooxygenase SsuD/methylene tetrahydromethanopterin reductase-like flavin-dependent oxidoreductase (luciferase family)